MMFLHWATVFSTTALLANPPSWLRRISSSPPNRFGDKPLRPTLRMVDSITATVVDDDLWESKGGSIRECQVEIRIQAPFTIERKMENHDEDKMEDDEHSMMDDDEMYEMDDGDVMIRGPVYVGNDEMLDRHGELVDIGAIFNAWEATKPTPLF